MSDTVLEQQSIVLVKKALARLITSNKCTMKQVAGVMDNLAKNSWHIYNLSCKQKKIYHMLMEELDTTIDRELS